MPNITLRLKRLGKKRVKKLPYELSELPESLRSLIVACVAAEVDKFNASRKDPLVLRFLTPEDIGKGATAGKIDFGEIHNSKQVDAEEAANVAIQAWKDGLFAVFHEEQELLNLDFPVGFSAGDNVTFIRLTFLTGTFW